MADPTDGGIYPAWARSGRGLFYVSTVGNFMAVPVVLAPAFVAGDPVRLFAWHYFSPPNFRGYDGGLDDKRFLVIEDAAATSPPPGIVVVENWFAEFNARVPKK